ncbi:SRPBCC family protein [Pedobacter miscanthi]|uniref:SRPBCC family protein n=1 Tax=Pedobacter miscanthi TaxID=2259170 RepID=UPI0029309B73|nr:SRPBCC family protein [Pedobacter miscanthi]
MWTKSYSIVTKDATKEQMWKLFSDVNNWHTWDDGIEYAKLNGNFEEGNHIELMPKGGPKVKINLLETVVNESFLDVTNFPFAKMFDNHTFEETEHGLKVTNTLTVKGALGFLWVKLVAGKMADALPVDMMNQIKTASRL